jgi:hypothetical protein
VEEQQRGTADGIDFDLIVRVLVALGEEGRVAELEACGVVSPVCCSPVQCSPSFK